MSKRRYTSDQVRARLRRETQGRQVQWALDHGVSPSYVANFLAGRVEPGARILRAMRLRRITLYEKED